MAHTKNEKNTAHVGYKILVVGDELSGKTNLISRYADDQYGIINLSTTFKEKQFTHIPGLKILTATGEYIPNNLVLTSYDLTSWHEAHAFIVTVDMTAPHALDTLAEWLDEIKQYGDNKAFIVITGTKSDKNNLAISAEALQQKVNEISEKWRGRVLFKIVSAKTGKNVEALFKELTYALARRDKLIDYSLNRNTLITLITTICRDELFWHHHIPDRIIKLGTIINSSGNDEQVLEAIRKFSIASRSSIKAWPRFLGGQREKANHFYTILKQLGEWEIDKAEAELKNFYQSAGERATVKLS